MTFRVQRVMLRSLASDMNSYNVIKRAALHVLQALTSLTGEKQKFLNIVPDISASQTRWLNRAELRIIDFAFLPWSNLYYNNYNNNADEFWILIRKNLLMMIII